MANKSNLDVSVEINDAVIIRRMSEVTHKAQAKLDAEVLKDSNKYCPMDTGALQKSGIINTVIGSGLVVWATPYAREQYYNKPNKSTQRNPNAALKWFEVAKSKNLKKWEKIANDEFN